MFFILLFTICPFHLIIGLQVFFVSLHRDLSTLFEQRIQCIFIIFFPRTAGILPKTSSIRKEALLMCTEI